MRVIQISIEEKLEVTEWGESMPKAKGFWKRISEKNERNNFNSSCRKLVSRLFKKKSAPQRTGFYSLLWRVQAQALAAAAPSPLENGFTSSGWLTQDPAQKFLHLASNCLRRLSASEFPTHASHQMPFCCNVWLIWVVSGHLHQEVLY